MVDIRYSNEATKSLRRCDNRKLIQEKIELLARDPLALTANVKRLTGRDEYRLRVQNWRILFRMENGILYVDDVNPRGSAYED